MPSYSLSSAPRAANSAGRTKRVSSQLRRFMGDSSRGLRPSSEDSARRRVSEDGRGSIAACSERSDNNRLSKAAAWMWYTRGIGNAAHASAAGAAVAPTQKQLAATNASRTNYNSTQKEAAAGAGCTQPSRFKQEADLGTLASEEAATTSSSLGAAHHESRFSAEERAAARIAVQLYDEFELSHVHELLDPTEIDKLHFKVSAPCHPSAAISTSLTTSPSGRQIKPLSAAFCKLFKMMYNPGHYSCSSNSSIQTWQGAHTGQSAADPRKLRSAYAEHVIHHHHHYHHHYRRSSLDSPDRDQSPVGEPVPHPQEVVMRRRRRSYHNYGQALGGLTSDGKAEAETSWFG